MINWEIGKAYRTGVGKRFVMVTTDKTYSGKYPILLKDHTGKFISVTKDGKASHNRFHENDIVGEWEEPKKVAIKCKHKNITPDHLLCIYKCDDCACVATFDSCWTADIHGDHEPDEVRVAMLVPDYDPFDYKSPPPNKTYLVPLPAKVLAEMKEYDDLRKATSRDVAQALRVPKELMVETPTYTVKDKELYRKAMLGELEEHKAPPTLISSPTYRDFNFDWGATAKTLEILRNDFNNANILARDNKPDDRRPRVWLATEKQQRRQIAMAAINIYRRNKATNHKYNEMWTDLVELRAADKPDSNRDSRPWYEKI